MVPGFCSGFGLDIRSDGYAALLGPGSMAVVLRKLGSKGRDDVFKRTSSMFGQISAQIRKKDRRQ